MIKMRNSGFGTVQYPSTVWKRYVLCPHMFTNYCNFRRKQFGEVVNSVARIVGASRLATPLRKH
jgi:hypothetical protein